MFHSSCFYLSHSSSLLLVFLIIVFHLHFCFHANHISNPRGFFCLESLIFLELFKYCLK